MRSIPRPTVTTELDEGRTLYLEVIVNGFSTGMLAELKEAPGRGLTAAADELASVGLKPAGEARDARGQIELDRLPGVTYEWDEASQSLRVTASDSARLLRTIDARDRPRGARPEPRADYGAVLNYSLFGATGALSDIDFGHLDKFSGSFDLRVFGPAGTVSHSFVAGHTSYDWMEDVVRLRTAWAYSDPMRMLTYRAGDLISGGLSWTRPVNLGGAQVQRNFHLRSDLVTKPLPSFSGSAAVPTTMEVYAENTRVWSTKVAPGPFEVVNLPVIGQSGEARIILRDIQGREIVSTLPFYDADILLREGLLDFSGEVGFPRRSIGVLSDDYDDSPFAILSARYGFSNRLTLEGHAEIGSDLVNGGMGAAFLLGRYGTASLAASASAHDDRSGAKGAASVMLRWNDWSIYWRAHRTFGDFDDVASVSARRAWEHSFGDYVTSSVPRAVDHLSLGIPVPLPRSHLRFAYSRILHDPDDETEVLSLNYSQEVWPRATFRASLFQNVASEKNLGLYAGLSIWFGNGISAAAGYDYSEDGARASLDVMKSERPDVGNLSWRARVTEGDVPHRSASGAYRSPHARFETTVTQYDKEVRATASAEGALVYAGGGLFATHRIHDAFAVVDVGAPDVEVRYQNRSVGVTGQSGRILVPNLRSFETNAISIDPTNLPVDANIPTTREVVVPRDGAGVVVNFGVAPEHDAAIVAFVDPSGEPIRAGSTARLKGADEPFTVGYDGETFLRNLKPTNVASIEQVNGKICVAKFAFAAKPGSQVKIGGVVCR